MQSPTISREMPVNMNPNSFNSKKNNPNNSSNVSNAKTQPLSFHGGYKTATEYLWILFIFS